MGGRKNPIKRSLLSLVPNYSLTLAAGAAGSLPHILCAVGGRGHAGLCERACQQN